MSITAKQRTMFPIRLTEAMARRNILPAQLADAAGVPRSSISGYKKGSNLPRGSVLSLLAELLDTNIEWLLGDDDVPFERDEELCTHTSMLAYWKSQFDQFEETLPQKHESVLAFLSERLHAAIAERGMTQTQLWEILKNNGDVTLYFPTLAGYFRGKSLPLPERLLSIAAVLEKHPLWLIGGEEEAWPGDDAVYRPPAITMRPRKQLPSKSPVSEGKGKGNSDAMIEHEETPASAAEDEKKDSAVTPDMVQRCNALLSAIGNDSEYTLQWLTREEKGIIEAFRNATGKEQNIVRVAMNLPMFISDN